MAGSVGAASPRKAGLLARWNGERHRTALNLFMVIVLAHWAEHLTQAFQIYVLGWAVPQSRGVLGLWFPWLVKSEWLHYGYALVMLVGLYILRKGFVGRGKVWWMVAFGVQFWHHVEHLLLFIQAQAGVTFFGKAVPTSVAQIFFPRVELHLFYNTVVFLPMLVALFYHLRPSESERLATACSCVRRPMALATAGS